MLQWMGGSRRKVTTSKKSIQKRQKQYFEQRRRQLHQQAAGFESSEGGGNKWEQSHKEHRSLDILSLLNFSTGSQECKPTCPSGREDLKANALTDPPITKTSTVASADSLEIRKASSLSGCQVETISPKKLLVGSQDKNSNAFNGISNKPDLWKTATEKQLCFFDLLGDEDSNGNSLESPTHEAHVVFSVDGLGKVGTELPLHLPMHPDRYVSYGCCSPLKGPTQLNSSRNLNCALNNPELEVDAIMQDIEMPWGDSSLDFSTGIKDSFSTGKKNLSTVRDYMQLDGQGSKVRSPFSDGKVFYNAGNDIEDLWDARSSLLDAHFVDEKQHDMLWKSWACHPDGNSADFLKYGSNERGPHLPKKRDASKAAERFNFLDLPALMNQRSENDFIISKAARHQRVPINSDFGEVTERLDWSGFAQEDAREILSLLSEESCSSTAVMDEVSNISPLNSRARDNRRHRSSFDVPEIKLGAQNLLSKEKHFKNKVDLQKRNHAYPSGKCTQMHTLSESKPTHNFNYLSQEKIGPHRCWLFEEGYSSADVNLGFSSLCHTSEAKQSSSGFKPSAEDIFDTCLVPESHIDVEFSFDSKHDSPVKSSPSGSCISKKFAFCQPSSHKHSHGSPTLSKVEFWATKPDFSLDSPDFDLESRLSHGESVSKKKGNISEFQQANYDNIKLEKEILVVKNMQTVNALDSEENIPELKELKDGIIEASLSRKNLKISDKSESTVDGEEHHHVDEVPLLCHNGNREIENGTPGDRKIASKRSQLMMLESYVLQLLCVQKVPKEASGQAL